MYPLDGQCTQHWRGRGWVGRSHRLSPVYSPVADPQRSPSYRDHTWTSPDDTEETDPSDHWWGRAAVYLLCALLDFKWVILTLLEIRQISLQYKPLHTLLFLPLKVTKSYFKLCFCHFTSAFFLRAHWELIFPLAGLYFQHSSVKELYERRMPEMVGSLREHFRNMMCGMILQNSDGAEVIFVIGCISYRVTLLAADIPDFL